MVFILQEAEASVLLLVIWLMVQDDIIKTLCMEKKKGVGGLVRNKAIQKIDMFINYKITAYYYYNYREDNQFSVSFSVCIYIKKTDHNAIKRLCGRFCVA